MLHKLKEDERSLRESDIGKYHVRIAFVLPMNPQKVNLDLHYAGHA